MERDDKEWAQYLPAMTLAYNTKVHASTGVTPFYAKRGKVAGRPSLANTGNKRNRPKSTHKKSPKNLCLHAKKPRGGN